MTGKRLTILLPAMLTIYCLVIIIRYAAGYPELVPAHEFAAFVLFTVGLRLLFPVALAAAGYGVGGVLFARWLPDFGSLLEEGMVKTFLGLGVISYMVFAAGLTHLIYPATGYAILAACLILGGKEILGYVGRVITLPHTFTPTFSVVVLLAVSAYFLLGGIYGSLLPPTGFDPLMYHLGVPRVYLSAHAIFPTPDINGSSFPFGVEMLYLLGMMVDGPISANMVNYAFAVAGGLSAAAFTRRFLPGSSALMSFSLYVCVPMVVWLMPQAYVEFALAAYTMLAIHALLASLVGRDRRWFAVGALLAGFTLAIKYTGAIGILVMLLGIVVYKLFSERSGLKKTAAWAGVFVAVCAVVPAPWYVKNLIYYKNPVYPFMQEFFGGVSALGASAASFFSGGLGGTLTRLASSLWRTTFYATEYKMGFINGFGPYFLMLVPGIFLFKKPERELKYLAGFCLIMFALLAPLENLRYFLPLVPALAVLAAYPAGRLLKSSETPSRVTGVVLVALFAFSALMANTPREGVEGFPSSSLQAMDKYYSEDVRSGYLASYNAWKWIDQNLPADAVIYQLWDDASVYFRRRKTLGVSLPWGDTGRQQIHRIIEFNQFGGYLPGEEMIANLRRMGAGYLLINANREGHAVPDDPYFQAHTRLLFEDKGVLLYQIGQ